MSDFNAKMHQIVCQLGLHPKSRWRAYSAPQTPWLNFRRPTFNGEGWKGGMGCGRWNGVGVQKLGACIVYLWGRRHIYPEDPSQLQQQVTLEQQLTHTLSPLNHYIMPVLLLRPSEACEALL